MLSLIASSLLAVGGAPERAPVHPTAARHHGRHEGNALVWQSVAIVDAAHLSLRGADRLPLAAPLPKGATVEATTNLGLVEDDDGRVIAVDVPAGLWGPEHHHRGRWTRAAMLTVRQQVSDRERVAMVVPLFAGDGVQRITMAGMENLLFEPDATIGIERHIRHFVGQEITSSMRRACTRLLREHGLEDADGLAIFVTATRRVTDAGSLGEIVSRESHRRLVAMGAIVGCACIALLMVLAYKRLSHTAQIERSLAIIDRDLADLEDEAVNRATPTGTRSQRTEPTPEE